MPLPLAWAIGAGAVALGTAIYAVTRDDDSSSSSSSSYSNREEEERRAKKREQTKRIGSLKSDIQSFQDSSQRDIKQRYSVSIKFDGEKVNYNSNNPLSKSVNKLKKEMNSIKELISELETLKTEDIA